MAETISIRIVDDSPAQPAGSQSTVTDTGKPVTESPAIPAGSVVGTMPPMGYVGPNVMPVAPVVGGQVGKGKVVEGGETVGPNVANANDTNARTLETLDVAKRSIETAKRETIQPDASRGVVQNIANNTVNSVVPTTGQKVEQIGIYPNQPAKIEPNPPPNNSKNPIVDAIPLDELNKFSLALNAVTKSADRAGNMLSGMAGNERVMPGQIVGGLKDILATPMKMIPGPVGAGVAMGSEVVDAILKIPDKLTAAFLKQAEKFAPYSGQIAAAQANAEIKTIMADFREAQSTGESYARLIDAQSKIDLTLRELLLPIKRAVLDATVKYAEAAANNAKDIGVALYAITLLGIDNFRTIIQGASKEATKDLGNIVNKAVDEILGKNRDKDLDMFGQFFREAENAKFTDNPFAG